MPEGTPGPIQSAAKAASSLTTAAQYRQTLREMFQTTITPAKFRTIVNRLYTVATEGKGAEQFRAADLLIRIGIGNPAVHGDAEVGGGSGDEAQRMHDLMSALPRGFALIRAGEASPAPPSEWRPGDYVVDEVPGSPPPAPPAPASRPDA